ncbi:hypothetical protein FACS189493_4980 [Spirochaetia bacterium]|nr:hypothetical protein FACS189493_4980 [Spirochaetia bacterium]
MGTLKSDMVLSESQKTAIKNKLNAMAVILEWFRANGHSLNIVIQSSVTPSTATEMHFSLDDVLNKTAAELANMTVANFNAFGIYELERVSISTGFDKYFHVKKVKGSSIIDKGDNVGRLDRLRAALNSFLTTCTNTERIFLENNLMVIIVNESSDTIYKDAKNTVYVSATVYLDANETHGAVGQFLIDNRASFLAMQSQKQAVHLANLNWVRQATKKYTGLVQASVARDRTGVPDTTS